MKLKDKIEIAAEPEQVWMVISEPEFIKEWNHQLKGIREVKPAAEASGGYDFVGTFQLSDTNRNLREETLGHEGKLPESGEQKERQPKMAKGSTVVWEPFRLLRFRYTSVGDGEKPWEVFETYELHEKDSGTVLLKREVDLSGFPFPWWARLIMRLIFAMGVPIGKTMLEQIKELVE